jgi:prevent-host-death family protein
MRRVKIGEFRNRASEFIRRAEEGETVVIMNREREVARLVPAQGEGSGGALVGCLAGTAEVLGDLDEPIAAAEDWFGTGT